MPAPPTPPTPPTPITCDIAIHGGGIAGLWTLSRLRRAGYRCILLEKTALGAGQTVASQGIIHGGIKYALTGSASRASRAIAEMPAIWRSCLQGDGDTDLRAVTTLSERQYLWTTRGLGAKIAGVAASKAIRTEVTRITDPADLPPWLAPAPRGLGGIGGIDIYTVEEPILDPASIVRALARNASSCIFPSDTAPPITAKRHILTAGAGNAQLLHDLGVNEESIPSARMQLRPLHMVMLRARALPLIYGHCLGPSTTPRLTITSQLDPGGRTVLYLGGALAEEGVPRTRDDQLAAARAELRSCLPWLDWSSAEAATLRIDRAEGLTEGGTRPDEPVITDLGAAIAVWPTKLAFAPLVAQRILTLIEHSGLRPTGDPAAPTDVDLTSPNAAPVPIAKLPWDEEHVKWT